MCYAAAPHTPLKLSVIHLILGSMESTELRLGRTFGVTFEHGKKFLAELEAFCEVNDVRQGYIPMFIAAFKDVELVGASEKLEDPDAPVWSKVHAETVEVIGAGTLTYDKSEQKIKPHIHVSVGEKPRSAAALTSHLLDATVAFLTEMLVIEVLEPKMERVVNSNLYNVPLLKFR